VSHFDRSFMKRCKTKSHGNLNLWIIEIFTFSSWIMLVIFTKHYLEIRLELVFFSFYLEFLRSFRIDRFTSFPIILYFFFKSLIIFNAISRSFENIFQLITVLNRATTFIKKFFVLSMKLFIIF
jgi:hypothetical protein